MRNNDEPVKSFVPIVFVSTKFSVHCAVLKGCGTLLDAAGCLKNIELKIPSMDFELYSAFPYTAISISIIARFLFLFLLYKNKSTNNYSLAFCILNIGSSTLWVVYSLHQRDDAMLSRSITEIVLLITSSVYIVHNKIRVRREIAPINDRPTVQNVV